MAATGERAGEIDKLKSLLFSPEAARLDAAEAQIEGLARRVGDARRMEAATAEILVEAFRRAEVARHRELAAAVAPVVVAAIRNEISNSKDMMVEALYPITGRLVSAAVANAFRELIESINQRLDRLLSTRHWRMRIQSWFTGRPLAEIVLAQARAPVFRRIFLFERGSGRVIANWRLDQERQDNPELISGMIAAISEFATNVLADQGGELRTLDLGGSKVFLRASARIVLAAELIGELRQKALIGLDRAFLDLVDRQERGQAVANGDLAALAADLADEEPLGAARPWRLRAGVVATLIVALIALAAAGPFQRWRKHTAIMAAFDEARAAEPGLLRYPLRLEIDPAAGHVVLRGLLDSSEQADAMLAKLAAAAFPYEVTDDVALVATPASLQSLNATVDARLAALAARLSGLDDRLAVLGQATKTATADASAKEAAEREALRRQMEDALTGEAAATATVKSEVESLKGESAAGLSALSAKIGALETELAAASHRIDAAVGDLGSPHRRLIDAIAQSAIFFGDDDNFAEPETAVKTLDALAPVIIKSKESLRVVGHADVTGGPWINARLSQRRADKVAQMLRDRGVPAGQLVAVARGAQESIAVVAVGVAQVNRRVTFELLLSGEKER